MLEEMKALKCYPWYIEYQGNSVLDLYEYNISIPACHVQWKYTKESEDNTP